MYPAKKYLFFFICLFTGSQILAQYPVEKEAFGLLFQHNGKGYQWIYNGRGHLFSITVTGKKIDTVQLPNYISVDNQIMQTSNVPLPENKLDLTHLPVDKQKEILSGYVDYELDYFKNDLQLTIKGLQKEWITLNNRLWLQWSFNLPEQKAQDSLAIPVVKQIYVSTICFNQVLDLNTPINKGDDTSKAKAILKRLMATVKLSNRPIDP